MKISQVTMLFMLAMTLSVQSANSTKAVSHRKLIPLTNTMQEPIFDTSLVPAAPPTFKGEIDHTQIVYPKDPSILLHGDNKMVDLSGTERKDILRARIVEEQRDSILNTHEYGVKPRFSIDLRVLEGKYAPDMERFMDAEIAAAQKKLAAEVEKKEKLMDRQLRSRKPIADLPPLKANTNAGPDADKALKAAIEKGQRDANQRMKQLDPELDKAKQLQGKIPAVGNKPVEIPSNPQDSSGPGKNKIAFPKIDVSAAEQQMQKLLSGAGNGAGLLIAAGGGNGNPQFPSLPPNNAKMPDPKSSVNGIPSIPKVDTSLAQQQLENKLAAANTNGHIIPTPNTHVSIPDRTNKSVSGELTIPKNDPTPLMADELAKAKLMRPPNLDVDAELLRAKKQAQAKVDQAQPLMNTLLTHIRRLPTPTTPSGASPQADEDTDVKLAILWDAWHAQFGDMARDPILKAVSQLKNTKGEDTVEITVSRNHHIIVRMSKPGKNAEFDKAILQAYQSLDGDARLEYPPGSRRRSVTFLVDNEHNEPGTPTSVKSQTTVGDKELLHNRK